ncbi:2-oxoglutarate-dependent dioxygenase 19-like [Malania oleifera]|uniref:2-oxoglutarate-dependent dioxygenase 19-like n=1 Tax=Malania oleifera TaxID=397392 RepID=UPI0025ADF0AC|nr:2-oxoglutarate-dependent dioxygenase 19-like [Malania oleifera]
MAAIASAVPKSSPAIQEPKAISIRTLAESDDLTSIPSTYVFNPNPNKEPEVVSDPGDSLPIVDFSLLAHGTPDQRSKAVQDLGKACEEWGFFMVINHGVSESLRKSLIDVCQKFFNMTVEEKKKYLPKSRLQPIKVGTSFNRSDDVHCWRDFLNVIVRPTFYCPDKPQEFSELLSEYTTATREVLLTLLRGISESLGLGEDYIEKVSNQESGFQMLVANLYPPCPQPDLAMGISTHTDDGLLNLLTENISGGLQIIHDGQWVYVKPAPNAFLVNVGDHIEILSNGKYKSVLHRAIVNNKTTRVSMAVSMAPSIDTVVSPAPELTDADHPPAYLPMKYRDYLEIVHSEKAIGASVLDQIRVPLPPPPNN